MNPQKQANIRLNSTNWDEFCNVAKGSHMMPTKYASVWLSVLSGLKPEHALDALGSIPKGFFRDVNEKRPA